MVDFEHDLAIYKPFLQAAYEKANIWPLKEDAVRGLAILQEEIEEAVEAAAALDKYAYNEKLEIDVTETKALAVSAICELLQVIAVCNKYREVFTKGNE